MPEPVRNPLTDLPTAALTPWDQAALRGVLARMPYLPLIGGHAAPETVADLIAILAGLADTLKRYGEQARANEEGLHRLQDDIAAVRRVLGVSTETREGTS